MTRLNRSLSLFVVIYSSAFDHLRPCFGGCGWGSVHEATYIGADVERSILTRHTKSNREDTGSHGIYPMQSAGFHGVFHDTICFPWNSRITYKECPGMGLHQ